MSEMQPGGNITTQQQKVQGQETFLSPEERAQIQRLMGHPTDYPKELRAWIRNMLEVDPPDIPISNFKGKGVPKYIVRAASDSMTSVSGSGEQSMFTTKLKAKTLSPTGQLRVLFFFTARSPDDTNTVTVRFKLGSTTVISFAMASDILEAAAQLGASDVTVVNAGSYSAQLITLAPFGVTGTNQAQAASSSVDLSQDNDLSITAQWTSGDSNDVVAPQYVAVEVFNPVGA